MNLKTKIIFFVLEISLISLMFIGFIFYSNNEIQINRSTLKQLDSIAQIQKNRLQDILIQKQDLLNLFLTKPLLRSYLKDFNTQPTVLLQNSMNNNLLETESNSSSIKQIFIANLKGKIIASTDLSLLGVNVFDKDFFKKGVKSNDVSFFNKDNSGNIVQYLSGPLILNKEVLGVVFIINDAKDIIGLANDYTGLGDTGETLLAKDDGNGNALFLTPIRFDKNAGLVRVVTKEKQNIPSIHAINGEENIFNNFIDYRGKKVFAATRYLESVGLGIVVKIDKAEVMIPIKKLQELFLFLILGAIIIIIFLTIPISSFITLKEKELDKQKDEVISFASHQLKNPITATSWNLEMLLDGSRGKLTEKQRETLKEIYGSNKNMLELITGFLDISKIESEGFLNEKGEVDLLKISDSVLEELAEQISVKKINIVKKYGDDVPQLNIGTKTARIIFQNLITNAVKYTQENGIIEIKIEKKINGGVSVSVKDTGYGIPKDAQKRIFSKLFRADNIKEKEPSGTGLGLYLLKSLVEKLGGKVWFESEEGVGTTFYVDLK
ncbi:MAG: sensor histidine kinase [Minisyncoccia bacterium]